MSSVFHCGDPNCPGDLQSGAAECGLCGRTRSKLGPVDPGLTRPPGVRAELVLGNRFRLVRVLGAGGMGEVWLAEDLSLERAIACKVVKPDLVGDRRALVNLRREVKLTLDLTHKSIVRVYQYHEMDGIHFIAMEYVEGQSLDHALTDRLEQDLGPFPLDDVLRMLKPIATALDYAHGENVLHRDVKPGNILLDAAGATKLADFGIARVVTDATNRQTGRAPAYSLYHASPEQEMGKELGPASDQYSLAITVYELLNGNPPFHTGNITAQRQMQAPAPLRGQPEHVNAALLKALSRDPEKRFASCSAFMKALAQPAKPASAPPVVPPVPKAPEAARPSTAKAEANPAREKKAPVTVSRMRHGGVLGGLGVCVLLLIAVIGFYGTTPESPRQDQWEPPPAPRPAPPVRPETDSSPMEEPPPASESLDDPTAGTERSFEIAPGVEMTFVWIPPGEFMMGSPETEEYRYDDEGPQHRVTISRGFWLGKYEVTQAEWEAVMGSNPSYFEGAKNPVEMVSWDDCQEFLEKASGGGRGPFRLPTEAEWEYACRAGTTTPFHFGPTITPDEVNYDGNYPYGNGAKGIYREKTTEVGSFPANPWGLHDMHGNVWEWCSDWYGSDYYGQSPTTDPTGPSGESRVLRGGSWDNDANYCRSANRGSGPPGSRFNGLGLRVVRTSV